MAGFAVIALSVAAAAAGAYAQTGEPLIRALLLTGENNHHWRYTSRLHEDTLEATGLFDVDVADDAASALQDAAGLARYQLLVLDYNGKPWGEQAQANFVKAVEGGTGLVVIHASNNAFPGWKEYEEMVGLLWREGTGHGRFHSFDVEYKDTSHPITRELTDMAAHPDELYHDLKNPQGSRFQVLATAFSDPESGGVGSDQPIAIVLEYGKGRIFHTPLGHVWEEQNEQKRSVSDPQFRLLLARGAEWAATGDVSLGAEFRDARPHNMLSEAERAAGWRLLFDGATTEHFRGFKREGMPEQGWVVEDGTLRHEAGKGGGDLITRDQYGSFEFACDWKVAPGGNSGIMYRSTEDGAATYTTGPEMQILDNAGHNDGKNTSTSAAALYAMIPAQHDVIRPAGEWNSVRILVDGDRVEHWANGWKVLEYRLNSPEWDELVKGSKFKDWPDFGRKARGHIALQDHGDDVWFRNIKVRPLP